MPTPAICIGSNEMNKNILRRHYALKNIEEIFASISGSEYVTLLDGRRGFWQNRVSERTQKYLTFAFLSAPEVINFVVGVYQIQSVLLMIFSHMVEPMIKLI